LTVIHRSSEKVGYWAKGFPQGVPVLGSHHQLTIQDLNSFLDLHKIPVSTTLDQLGKSKIFLGSNNYLLFPVVVALNQHLHILNVLKEFLLFNTES
jgi:hypothetical protein